MRTTLFLAILVLWISRASLSVTQVPERPVPGKAPNAETTVEPNPWRIMPKITPLEAAEKPGLGPASSPWHHAQAGCPLAIHVWAMPSDTRNYIGYPVGGGCPRPCKADPPTVDEGTWGWDYRGWLLPRHVYLGWWHGRYQGGTGAYQTDGPGLNHGQATVHEHP